VEAAVMGGVSGALTIVAGMPLLTLKFCKQSGRALPSGLLEYYRGATVQAVSSAPVAALQMCVNGMMARMITGSSPLSAKLRREMTYMERMGAGLSAGIISAILYTPVDLITIQQQRLGMNLADTFFHVVHAHGPLGLLRGAMAMSIREGIFTMGLFGLTPLIGEALVKQFPRPPQLAVVCRVVASILAGVFAAVITHPVDTVKTVIQTDLAGVTYRNVWQAIAHVAKERGFLSLYHGIVPRTCLTILSFFITTLLKSHVERLKARLEDRRGLPDYPPLSAEHA